MGVWTASILALIVTAAAAAGTVSHEQKFAGKLIRRDQPESDDPESLKNIAHGCQHVFLDVGSNRGVHVRAIFEPSKYPLMNIYWNQAVANSSMYEVYTSISSGKKAAHTSNVCTFGFEANPDFKPRLHALEESYAEQGWRARWFNLAVSDSVGNLTFYREPKGGQLSGELESNSDGASLAMRQMVGTTVNTIDLAQFLQDNIVNRRIPDKSAPATVVMKMDIEGAEFKVLPHLMEKGLMCKGHGIDAMTLEWHEGRDPKTYAWHHNGVEGPGPGTEAAALHKKVASQGGGCQPTDLLDIDDEIAAFDMLDLPSGKPIPSVLNDVNEH